MGESVVVTNGCADNMSGTSEVPQLTDPLCAPRKSAEVGQILPSCSVAVDGSLFPDSCRVGQMLLTAESAH